MPLSAAFALQTAVYSALAADAELTAMLGESRVFDAVPENTPAPYVRLGEAVVRDASTGTEAAVSIRFAVVVWSRAAGRGESLAIAERVRARLHDATLVVVDHVLVDLRHEQSESRTLYDPDGRRLTLRFRAELEPVSA